jgi:hypothetical protein
MQGNNAGQSKNEGGNKPSGLSWSTPAPGASSPLLAGSKGSQTSTPPMAKAQTINTAANTSRPKLASDNSMGRSIGFFVAGVIVGALLIWGWNSTNSTGNGGTTSDTASSTNTNSNGATALTGTGNNNSNNTTGSTISGTPRATGASFPVIGTASNMSVADQAAGNKVMVTSATVDGPTWLAVFEISGNKPIRVLGASLFTPQNNGKGWTIKLQRDTEPGVSYFVGQILDSNSDLDLTLHSDKEVLDTNGNFAGIMFKAQ